MPFARAAFRLAVSLTSLFATSSTIAQTIWYVDDDAPLGGNGQSWLTPYRFLQDALSAAASGDQIRIAGGTYTPDRDAAHPDGTGDRHATFQLKNGVAIYGGYAGIAAPGPDVRNTLLYESLLSGDLSSNDLATQFPYGSSHSENSYHVVTGSGTDGTAVLDGLVITAGHADDFDYQSQPRPDGCGGGMYTVAGSPMLYDCVFRTNFAYEGGGMHNMTGSSPILIDVTFSKNWSGSDCAGMRNVDGSCPMLNGCVFSENFQHIGSPNSYGYGGGLSCENHSDAMVLDCTFVANTADGAGGMMCYFSNPQVHNCLFAGNTASSSSPVACGGGAIIWAFSSALMSGCTITANTSRSFGGGMYCTSSSNPTLTNCAISGNTATYYGGGVYCNYSSSPTLANCIISGNTASGTHAHGGGVCCSSSSPMLINCTISRNTASGTGAHGGGVYCSDSRATLTNCILRGDTPQEIDLSGTGNNLTVTFSDIQGGYAGAGNINLDPRFVNPTGGNFHLAANSPCIDVGSSAAVPAGITTDIDGDPRILPGHPLHITLPPPGQPLPPPPPPVVDMGADEFKLAPLPEPDEAPIGSAPIAPTAGIRHR